MSDVGASLREAREAQGLEIAEVARRTRVPIRHLSAIESGDHGGLPAATYSAGFVKTYARVLGLDSHALSQQFRDELAPREQLIRHEPYEPADPARTPSRMLVFSTLALAVLALLGYLYWRGSTVTGDPVKLAAESSDSNVPSAQPRPQALVAAPVPATGQVTLVAQEQAWVRVYEMAGGRKLFEGILQPNQTYVVPADAADPRLLTSRPNVLRVSAGNMVIPPLGPPERRIRDVSLKAASLLARLGSGVPAAATPVPLAPGAAVPVENSAGPE